MIRLGGIMSYTLEGSKAYSILEERKAYSFIGDIRNIYSLIAPLLNEICIKFDNYTLHNIDHSLRVLHYMCEIAGENTLTELSNLELAMIIDVALLHDIGMYVTDDDEASIKSNSQFNFYLKKNKDDEKLALQDFIRPIHGKRSYKFITEQSKIRELLFDRNLSTISYCEDVALICQSHMESIEWINENLKEDFTRGDSFNSKYIALLLRIADYIDFDSQRAPRYLFEHKSLNDISLAEWQKHATICNYEKIDKRTNEIFFDIDCDDFHLYCKLMDTIESMDKEVRGCVHYSESFRDLKYRLRISESIRAKVDAKGFFPERFSFTLDYYNVTNLLMGENLYGDKKIGFRELLQNSLDACHVMKEYYATNDVTINYTPQIDIIYDYDNKLVMIRDNGTGMSKDIISKYFLTVGKSYYQSDEYKKLGYGISPTGTFGIGFLSCFMLSQNVTIITKYYKTGETNSFLLEKKSKYICHLDKPFPGPHGTAIYLSLPEFGRVFSKALLMNYIDNNFYRLDAKIDLYELQDGITKYVDKVEAKALTRFLDIDLSSYLNGVECKANVQTILDEFIIYKKFPSEKFDVRNSVLIKRDDIQLIHKNAISQYYSKRCLVINSVTAFESILDNVFNDVDEIADRDYDLSELLEYFETYGFDVFTKEFCEYTEETIDCDEEDVFNAAAWPVCIYFDDALSDEFIKNAIKKARTEYLLSVGVYSHAIKRGEVDSGYLARYSEVTANGGVDNPAFGVAYKANVCYRDVFLKEAQILIPGLANLITQVLIVANITRDDFIPSVTRSGLTREQRQTLSYAVGKALHKYLIEYYTDDEEVSLALKRLLAKAYNEDNMLCK